MNKWIRRTAGTVGIAGGALLLGTAAHADNSGLADPQALHDVASTANLDGGLSGVGVSVDTPGTRDTVGLLPDGGDPIRTGTNNGELGAVVHTPSQDGQPRDIFANTGRTPDLFQALPITDVVPMDGLGLPTGGSGGLTGGASGLTGGSGLAGGAGGLTGATQAAPKQAGKPSPGRPSNRTLPAPAEAGETGLPVRNLPIGTSVAGDTLSGGDALARDGLAGNGLGVPMGDQLPVGAVQGVASQGQSLGGQAVGGLGGLGGGGLGGGGLPVGGGLGGGGLGGGGLGGGGLGGLGGGLPVGGLGGGSGQQAQSVSQQPQSTSQQQSTSRQGAQSSTALIGDAVHVLPAGESLFAESARWARAEAARSEASLPTAGGLPVVGNVLQGGTLPMKGNINTLPGAPTLPVHDLLAPGTSAAGASTGNALNNASGAVNGLGQSAGTESLPLGSEGLPVVGGLTSAGGTQGLPLPTSGLPVLGGLAGGLGGANAGGLPGGGLTGGSSLGNGSSNDAAGRHRAPATGTQYVPRHAS
jgi:hypothetical protein